MKRKKNNAVAKERKKKERNKREKKRYKKWRKIENNTAKS